MCMHSDEAMTHVVVFCGTPDVRMPAWQHATPRHMCSIRHVTHALCTLCCVYVRHQELHSYVPGAAPNPGHALPQSPLLTGTLL